MPNLFIYGTLKKGMRNAQIMDNAVYLGEAVTAQAAWDLGVIEDPAYPYPIMTSGSYKISGELYRLCDEHLAAVDAFELALPGTPDQEYARREIALENGQSAFAYIALPALAQKAAFTHSCLQEQDHVKNWSEDTEI